MRRQKLYPCPSRGLTSFLAEQTEALLLWGGARVSRGITGFLTERSEAPLLWGGVRVSRGLTVFFGRAKRGSVALGVGCRLAGSLRSVWATEARICCFGAAYGLPGGLRSIWPSEARLCCFVAAYGLAGGFGKRKFCCNICSWECGYFAARIPFIIVDLRSHIRVSKNMDLHFWKKKIYIKKNTLIFSKNT